MYPSYLQSYNSGLLQRVADQTTRLLESCTICPRNCRVNRLKGEKGFCQTADKALVYSFMAHHGEEPPISGTSGSGTIFFSRCNMACVYCQNFEFSQEGQKAREVTDRELADIMLELQERGCHNINFVTPTHVMPQILKALCLAIPSGLKIPLVYNTSGYELPEMIRLLDGIIDVYLPDMRYADPRSSQQYSRAPDYPKFNQASAEEMQRQVGVAQISQNGLIEKGLIIRHLVLPGEISGTKQIMRFIAEKLSVDTHISLMSQYLPCYQASDFKELSRRITLEEYETAEKAMHDYGLYNGWVQESHGLDRFAGIHIKPSFRDKE